jgi:hypothetical protein
VSLLALTLLLAGGPRATLGNALLRVPGPAPAELRLAAGRGETHLEPRVGDGERFDLRVPFLRDLDRPGVPGAAELGLGDAPVELVPGGVHLPGDWRDLPAPLRARPLPPLEEAPPRPGRAAAAALLAAAIAVLALRRRPVLALAAGAAGALVLIALPVPMGGAPREVQVLEGDGDSGRWLLVRSARGRLELGADETGWVEVRPGGHPVAVRAARGTAGLQAALEAPAAELHLRRERVAPRAPGRGDAGGHDFLRVWIREPGEGWSDRGPWEGSDPLPPGLEAGSAPPGWLVAGLPQGVPALVGELRAPGGRRSWLRLAPLGP